MAARFVTLIGLAKIDLPDRTLRLCDGGQCDFDGERYAAKDDVFGTIAAIEPIEDKLGDTAPGGRLVLLPASDASAVELSRPDYQNSRIRYWLGEIGDDGLTVGNAEPLADLLWDTAKLVLSRGRIALEITTIARAEKLFLTKEGNTLSTAFHQRVWAGERGFDNANGLQRAVAWGTESPPRDAAGSGYGGGGGGGGFSVVSLS